MTTCSRWVHSELVTLPSVGIRAHRIFLSDRRGYRQMRAPLKASVVGAPVWDGRADGGRAGFSAFLSLLVVVVLCACALRVL